MEVCFLPLNLKLNITFPLPLVDWFGLEGTRIGSIRSLSNGNYTLSVVPPDAQYGNLWIAWVQRVGYTNDGKVTNLEAGIIHLTEEESQPKIIVEPYLIHIQPGLVVTYDNKGKIHLNYFF